ncbi:endonuclease III domain-containing protein [Desulfofustis glycolicus]|uniref:DNA-3-methyladenine glycosylase III n=1 Tax=Desulfofustis glycolicus DSM 9705 TaxID=1121409 RepID=A0A1M5UGD5_9BACT|nr:endonuclease [Desulfofustis glycolicus]MCB2217519.1 endonuclease III domain-containing protein [Desulfobulbaceae bacterium]SHH61886.1 DNA-3-methyladenine glycosylase III [Desulfofustis glycolicus DSM 9705]
MTTRRRLQDIYDRLFEHFGPQRWWPAESAFEVMVGAVLTQNTNWRNVTVAIDRLREGDFLRFERLAALAEAELAEMIRPSGYFNVKARRLLNLLRMIGELYDGEPERMLTDEIETARARLLAVTGIGEETADSILLYAGNQPVFVVDAYTYRICSRHQLIDEECDYRRLQEVFMDNLPRDAALFNEYHALLVMAGKHYCKKKTPLCERCPLWEV